MTKEKLVYCPFCGVYKKIVQELFGQGKMEFKLECCHYIPIQDAKIKFDDGRY